MKTKRYRQLKDDSGYWAGTIWERNDTDGKYYPTAGTKHLAKCKLYETSLQMPTIIEDQPSWFQEIKEPVPTDSERVVAAHGLVKKVEGMLDEFRQQYLGVQPGVVIYQCSSCMANPVGCTARVCHSNSPGSCHN